MPSTGSSARPLNSASCNLGSTFNLPRFPPARGAGDPGLPGVARKRVPAFWARAPASGGVWARSARAGDWGGTPKGRHGAFRVAGAAPPFARGSFRAENHLLAYPLSAPTCRLKPFPPHLVPGGPGLEHARRAWGLSPEESHRSPLFPSLSYGRVHGPRWRGPRPSCGCRGVR